MEDELFTDESLLGVLSLRNRDPTSCSSLAEEDFLNDERIQFLYRENHTSEYFDSFLGIEVYLSYFCFCLSEAIVCKHVQEESGDP